MKLKKIVDIIIIFFLVAPLFAKPINDVNACPTPVEYR